MPQPSFPDFVPDWHHDAGIDLEPELLDGRVATVKDLRDGSDKPALLGLARCAFDQEATETGERIRTVAQEYEEMFRNRGNDNLVALIAGISLFATITGERVSEARTAARLATGARAAGLESSLLTDLDEAARRVLATASVEDRRIAEKRQLAHVKAFDKKARDRLIHAEGATPPITAFPEAGNVIAADLNLVRTELQQTRRFANALAESLDIANRVNREQADILWWILSERSTLAQRSWSDIPEAAQPLMAALELAALTGFESSPPAQSQFLAEFAGKDESVSLRVSAQAIAETGVAIPAVPDGLAPFVPIWSGVNADHEDDLSLSGLDLAERAYAECLLMASVQAQ